MRRTYRVTVTKQVQATYTVEVSDQAINTYLATAGLHHASSAVIEDVALELAAQIARQADRVIQCPDAREHVQAVDTHVCRWTRVKRSGKARGNA